MVAFLPVSDRTWIFALKSWAKSYRRSLNALKPSFLLCLRKVCVSYVSVADVAFLTLGSHHLLLCLLSKCLSDAEIKTKFFSYQSYCRSKQRKKKRKWMSLGGSEGKSVSDAATNIAIEKILCHKSFWWTWHFSTSDLCNELGNCSCSTFPYH